MTDSIRSLDQLQNTLQSKELPPLEKWNPPCRGDIDMRIAADGTWFYLGTPITRPAMIKLFAKVLLREQDRYFLVTPVEKLGIKVEDAPFVVNFVEFSEQEGKPIILFNTNVGDTVVVDNDHPIRMVFSSQGEPRPYVLIRRNLEALISRNVFYELIERGTERKVGGTTVLSVTSAGEIFDVGCYSATEHSNCS